MLKINTYIRYVINTIVANWWLVGILLVFVLLLYKDPFSKRTLIGNLEPFPDSFHYLIPPRCWLNDQGWKMCRPELEGVEPAVTPLYSITLLPFIATTEHPTVFYFANILLTGISFLFFFAIVKHITRHKLVQFLILSLYVTSYHLYWFPTLAMAENAELPLYVATIWLFTQTKKWWWPIGLGMAAAGFFVTKYALLPLSLCFLCIGILSLWVNHEKNRNFYQNFSKSVILLSVSFLISVTFATGGTFIQTLISLVDLVTRELIMLVNGEWLKPALPLPVTDAKQTTQGWFSGSYFATHLKGYLESTFGKPIRVLWDTRPFFPIWVGVGGWLGFFSTFKQSKFTWLTLATLFSFSAQIVGMSFFYSFDGRYAIVIIPAFLIGLTIGLDFLVMLYTKANLGWWIKSIIVFITTLYLLSLVKPLKAQVGLNIKYAENPWWQISIEANNDYFAHQSFGTKKPWLITLAAPYMIDLLGNNTYQPLPLHQEQDFHGSILEVWGVPKNQPLNQIYTDKILAGEKVYLANYGTWASKAFQARYDEITNFFKLELVNENCQGTCKIYRVTLKK